MPMSLGATMATLDVLGEVIHEGKRARSGPGAPSELPGYWYPCLSTDCAAEKA